MLFTFFSILSLLCFVLFVYPYLIYPILVARLPERPIARSQVSKSISILFCAFNEAASLPAKLANLRELKARHPSIEILAFDDGSSDGTGEILRNAEDVVEVVAGAGRSGKACGMKQLAAKARGDILVFTDANVILAEDALERLMPYYADASVGGVCGTLLYDTQVGSATAEVGTAYWKLDERLRSLESKTGSVMGADGSLFSVRRELYPDFPDSVLDDMTVSMGVVFAGRRLVKANDVFAFENSVSRRDEELRRKVRIGARSYHTHRYLLPQLKQMAGTDRFKYVSRKVLRWFGGLNLLLAVAFGLLALAALSIPLAIAAAAFLAMLIALVIRSRTGIFAKIGDAFLAIFATQFGVYKGLRGQTVTTWSPAQSR